MHTHKHTLALSRSLSLSLFLMHPFTHRYMFRNAEYVLALKDLMNLETSASLSEYKDAFERLDEDGSGYVETAEIESLLSDVYDGDVPSYEVDSFMRFFDSNKDGRISWQEFEQGLGAISEEQAAKALAAKFLLPFAADSDGDGEDDSDPDVETEISGECCVVLCCVVLCF